MTRSHYHLLLLNIISIVFYAIIFFNLKVTIASDIMFSTPDAGTYKNVADWLMFGIETESVSTRPILYPLIILITTYIGGVYGLWFLQFVFWLVSINLTYQIIKQITQSNLYSYIGALFLMSNLSLIALTLHGLTEITTVFLLSVLIFYIAKKKEDYSSIYFFQICVFILVLLTVVKPTFTIPLLILLLIVFPIFYLRKYLKNPVKFLKLSLILLPLIIQLSIIKTKYGEVKVSLIGSNTLREYIIPQGIEKIEEISFEEAKIKSRAFNQKEQFDYLSSHIVTYTGLFFTNIRDNLKGSPTFLLYPKGYEHKQMAKFETKYNRVFLVLNILFTALIISLLILLFKNRDISSFVFLFSSFSLLQYYIFVTGISFWQGDRLTLPAIAICACIFPITVFYYLKIFRQRKHQLTELNTN